MRVVHDGHDGDAEPTRATRRAYFPRARIWLTEYGYQSNPPDRILGVTPALQARYVSEGAYAAYRAPRVDLLIHFLYRDEPTLARFQSGLVTLNNTPRPALAAFELPLAETARSGSTTSLWGQLRAPDVESTAVLERRTGGSRHCSHEECERRAATSAGAARFRAKPSSEFTRAASRRAAHHHLADRDVARLAATR